MAVEPVRNLLPFGDLIIQLDKHCKRLSGVWIIFLLYFKMFISEIIYQGCLKETDISPICQHWRESLHLGQKW